MREYIRYAISLFRLQRSSVLNFCITATWFWCFWKIYCLFSTKQFFDKKMSRKKVFGSFLPTWKWKKSNHVGIYVGNRRLPTWIKKAVYTVKQNFLFHHKDQDTRNKLSSVKYTIHLNEFNQMEMQKLGKVFLKTWQFSPLPFNMFNFHPIFFLTNFTLTCEIWTRFLKKSI